MLSPLPVVATNGKSGFPCACHRAMNRSAIERPYGWVVAFASMVMMTIGAGAAYTVVVALKPIAAEFGWPRAVPSLCYALLMLGAGFGGLVMGRWADRGDVSRPLLVGALALPFGAWLASTSDGAATMFVAYGLFMGFLGNGAFVAPLLANATRWFDRRRGIAIGIVASGQTLAGALWPPILRYLNDALGWRQTFVIYAAIALVALMPLAMLLRRPPPRDEALARRDAAPWDRVALGWPAERVQVMLCLAIIGCCVAMAMPMVHLIAYATDLGISGARAAEMLAVLLAGAFVSRLAFGMIADRLGGLRTLLIGSSGQAAMLAAFAAVDSFWGLYLVAALFGLLHGGIVPSYALIVRELFPAGHAGRRIAMVILFGTIGMALGGWLGGQIFDLSGSYRPAFLVGLAFYFGNLMLVGMLLHRQSRMSLRARPA
jgi:MFS family permease